jgi:hypothetical protein
MKLKCIIGIFLRVNTVFQTLGELPFAELSGIKAFGLGLVQVANFCNKKYKKVIVTIY